MARILVVDDELNIRDLIKKYASYESYQVDEAPNGRLAVAKVQTTPYDLVIMDVMMPELDGFSAVKEIRKFSKVPVIILSARGEEYDRLHGFDLGIDDYVVKPFSPKELMMRIAAVLNRCGSRVQDDAANHYEFCGLKIEYGARIVLLNGERLEMTPKEYDLLVFLIKNVNVAVTREQLLSKVWGYDFFGDDRTIDTHMKLLRRKLGDFGQNIITLRGVGYRFEEK